VSATSGRSPKAAIGQDDGLNAASDGLSNIPTGCSDRLRPGTLESPGEYTRTHRRSRRDSHPRARGASAYPGRPRFGSARVLRGTSEQLAGSSSLALVDSDSDRIRSVCVPSRITLVAHLRRPNNCLWDRRCRGTGGWSQAPWRVRWDEIDHFESGRGALKIFRKGTPSWQSPILQRGVGSPSLVRQLHERMRLQRARRQSLSGDAQG